MVTSNIKVNSEHSIHLYNCIIGYFFLICQFLKPCRLIVVTPNWGVIFVRAVELGDKNRDIKVEQIEKCDRALRKMIDMLGQHYATSEDNTDVILCVTGDHTTPVRYGDHTYEPVPIAFGTIRTLYADLQAEKAPTVRFDEVDCG